MPYYGWTIMSMEKRYRDAIAATTYTGIYSGKVRKHSQRAAMTW